MGVLHSILLLIIFLIFTFNISGTKVAQYEPYPEDIQEEEYVDGRYEEVQFEEEAEEAGDYYDEEEVYEVEEYSPDEEDY